MCQEKAITGTARSSELRAAAIRVPALQTFADEEDRKRLSATALNAFVTLAKRWALSNAEAAQLLGVSPSSWNRIKRGRRAVLTQDQLTRISTLVGVYKGLHLLFADSAADRWPRYRNSGPLFENGTPIEVMMQGGIPRMLEVRRYVDAGHSGL